MFCGIWGAISVGLFADPKYLTMSHPKSSSAGLFYSNGNLLLCQVVGIFFVIGWVIFTMIPFFAVLHYVGWLR
jgi:Amt family ammonium transporter